jgi:hypothetical protein
MRVRSAPGFVDVFAPKFEVGRPGSSLAISATILDMSVVQDAVLAGAGAVGTGPACMVVVAADQGRERLM